MTVAVTRRIYRRGTFGGKECDCSVTLVGAKLVRTGGRT